MKRLLLSLLLASLGASASAQTFTHVGGKRYTGTVTLTSKFEVHAEADEMLSGATCFYPEGQEAKKIPRPRNDYRSEWFCLDNHLMQPVYQALHIPAAMQRQRTQNEMCRITGAATVELRGYSRDGDCECDDNDRSTLVRVVRVVTTPRIDCTPLEDAP